MEQLYLHKYHKYKSKYMAERQNRDNMFTLKVSEPWLGYIASGRKRVEGRTGGANKWRQWIGTDAIFFNDNRRITVKIIDIRHYDTLYDYLDNEGYSNVMPHAHSYQDAVDAYHKFYSDNDIIKRGGMLAIEITPVKSDR